MIDERQLPTHNIANKGFSSMRRFVARFNLACTLIENRPQSLTGHIVKRSASFKTKKSTIVYLVKSRT